MTAPDVLSVSRPAILLCLPLHMLCACLAGDIKLTRLVIFGALLGVLDPVLTIATAESGLQDVFRMPNKDMVDAVLRSQQSSTSNTTQSIQEAETVETTAAAEGPDSRTQWLKIGRNLRDKQRVKLSHGSSSDHVAILRAFEVNKGLRGSTAC